jgi:hypothetical protein
MALSTVIVSSGRGSAIRSIVTDEKWRDGFVHMKKKRRYLTATMSDGYVKTIGPTTDSFTHYWRIVAQLENGKTEVFWGHTRSLAEARRKHAPAKEAARMRGWKSFEFEIAQLVETPA